MPDLSCSQYYLQVQGMLQLQPVKLLILQLEEILTVGEALGQLWEETRQSEDGKQNRADERRRLIITISMVSLGENSVDWYCFSRNWKK